MSDLPYKVFNSSGQLMMAMAEDIRYPKEIELSMLDAGYTIKLNGKKLTKTEIRKRTERK